MQYQSKGTTMKLKNAAKTLLGALGIAAVATVAPMGAQTVTAALPADSPISAAVQVFDQTPTASAERTCRIETKSSRQGCTSGFPGATEVASQSGDTRAAAMFGVLNGGSASEVADSGTVTAGGGASVRDTTKAVASVCGRVDEKGAASAPNSTATSGGDWVITLPTVGGPC